ncbi:Hypothetical protein LUCI_4807 [Lucifera butyrica]|uniref:DUF4405 domain-containing protein n=1 Tax=Lucifera butyrica TaxID=1351585 RepID=A0A498RHE7_9FIRM|nr:DUF4405 domain-containing protein [Lucifera butyrica]VBB09512.1 Hypothetical protein LUCI_4807 [Lucifera butyrica]
MRKITSIILAIAFIIVSVSGVQMVVAHKAKPQIVQQQMIDNNGDKYTMARKEKPFYPEKAHGWAGFLFIGAGLVHLGINRKLMLSYFKFRRNRTNG